MTHKDRNKKWVLKMGAVFFIFILLICIVFLVSGHKSIYTVLVQTPLYTGQGIIYEFDDKEVVIVTAAHILEGLEENDNCTVFVDHDFQVQANAFYISETADVAFLLFDWKEYSSNNIGTLQVGAVKKDRARFDDLKEESYIFAYDYEKTKITGSVISPWIYLEDFDLNMMLAKLPLRQGMSGSGVYDKKGYFVGIICGSNGEEAAILPFSVIESEWIMAKDKIKMK